MFHILKPKQLLVVLLASFLGLSSCTEVECPLDTVVVMTCGLYDASSHSQLTLYDTLTVNAVGATVPLLNRAVGKQSFGLPVSYLRFDVYIGGEYAGLVCSCPDEGEDFYRFPFSVSSPDELADIRIECSYGVSDLAPEDAILKVMMGETLEEHSLLTLDFTPEQGKTYDLKLVPDGEETWKLVLYEAE